MVDSRTAPAVGDRDRRHAAQRIAAIGGAGGHDFPLSVPSPPPAGRRGSREPEPVDNTLGRAAAGLAVGLAATPRPRRRPARPAAPQPPPSSPERSPATAGGTGTDVRGAPHRPVAVAAVAMAAAPSAPARATSGRGAGYRTQGAAPADRRGQQVRGPAARRRRRDQIGGLFDRPHHARRAESHAAAT